MTIRQTLEKEWIAYGEDNAPSWEYVKSKMNSQVYELLFEELAPCTQKKFFSIYCKIDLSFGENLLNKVA